MLQTIIDNIPVMLAFLDADGQFQLANREWQRVPGWSAEEMRAHGDMLAEFHPDPVARKTVLDFMLSGDTGWREFRTTVRDGRVIDTCWANVPLSDGTAIGIGQDVTERKQADEHLRLAASVFENTDEGVIITDADAIIVDVNRAFIEITGYECDEVVGHNPRFLKSGHEDQSFYRQMWQTLARTGHWRGELWNRRKDGTVFPEWLTISSVIDDEGDVTHYVGVFSDISQFKRSQEQLQHLAHHDPLTDLPNRLLLIERLEHAIRRSERGRTSLAVLFLDLDHFKHINDSLGHAAGDRLLREVSAALERTGTGGRVRIEAGAEPVVTSRRIAN